MGGGISGLACAYYLRRHASDAPPIDIVLVESRSMLGGKISTQVISGCHVDTGPDAYLARAPELAALVDALGLSDEVRAPAAGGAWIWSRRRRRPLPASLLFGVPGNLLPLLRSGLLSPVGVARAGLDLVLPSSQLPADPSVADLLRTRFGSQVFERLVQPLLGGVHAGDASRLSLASAAPEIASLSLTSRSLYLGLRGRTRAMRVTSAAVPAGGSPAAKPSAPLVSVNGGLGRLTEALVGELDEVDIRTGVSVVSVTRVPHGFAVSLSDGSVEYADHVVLATPAFVTADLLRTAAPAVSVELDAIPYVDVATVTLFFSADEMPTLPQGTGFLVPPEEKAFIVGCTWLSAKWAHVADGKHVIVRAMVGRAGDDRWVTMTDAAIVETVRSDLARMTGKTPPPVDVIVTRWPRAMAQYDVGHGEILTAIDAALASVPGLRVTGAAYRGSGLAGCVAQARATASAVMADISSTITVPPVTEGAGR